MDYKEDLKNKLPELKKIEGFPIGTDEDILALSEPPYYTACPNPYIADFIKENGKPYDEATDDYQREPFVGDVSEGKNDPIYNAHSYHTKVPHKAIMKYIEHYTNEDDIILDGFCGTGMTGVAAQLLNRKAILSDLSPIATFISYNYNIPIDLVKFKAITKKIITEIESECSWMFTTNHYINNKLSSTKGIISYVVWSDVLICPYCKNEYVYWDYAISFENAMELDQYNCSHCNSAITKKESIRAFIDYHDLFLNRTIKQIKQIPVQIKYYWNDKKYVKLPDNEDMELIQKIEKEPNPYWFPSDAFNPGDKTNEFLRLGFTNIHHLYSKRNLYLLSIINNFADKEDKSVYKSLITSIANRNIFKGNRFVVNNHNPNGRINGPKSGTYYIPSVTVEQNGIELLKYKIDDVFAMHSYSKHNTILTSTQSVTDLGNIPENSIDYIFTDPPFGHNIMYSELNLINESWLKIKTNDKNEAVISSIQRKKIDDYNILMQKSFSEYYRVLKPKRWITVEFHNTKSAVWNGIRDALMKSGFIISNVAVLDKIGGTINQSYIAGAVEKDLVISAYKPSLYFSNRFVAKAGNNLEKDFINQFLSQMQIQPSIERTEKMLYSKMLSFYIQHGYEINMDAKSFYKMLNMSFNEIDGLWFTSGQIERYYEYKKKMKLEGIEELKSGSMFLFVTDEKSALVWLYNFISEPKSFSDIHTAFTQLANIQGDAVPELRELLEHNFVFENEKYRRPQNEPEHNQISEKREKALLREFESLLIKSKTEKGKIKLVRKEALLFGFETCYKTRRYQDILTVTNKLDKAIIENSAELNDFVEAAEIMVKGME